jgi:hypothetical protein
MNSCTPVTTEQFVTASRVVARWLFEHPDKKRLVFSRNHEEQAPEPPTAQDMLRASEVCAHAAKDPLNRGEIASILLGASRILANTSRRPDVVKT